MKQEKFDKIDSFTLFLINLVMALIILTALYGKMALVMVEVFFAISIITISAFGFIYVLFGINVLAPFKALFSLFSSKDQPVTAEN